MTTENEGLIKCSDCKGTGKYTGLYHMDNCRSCEGAGWVEDPDYSNSTFAEWEPTRGFTMDDLDDFLNPTTNLLEFWPTPIDRGSETWYYIGLGDDGNIWSVTKDGLIRLEAPGLCPVFDTWSGLNQEIKDAYLTTGGTANKWEHTIRTNLYHGRQPVIITPDPR